MADVLRVLPPEAVEAAARAYPKAYRAVVRHIAHKLKNSSPEALNGAPHAEG
jgi:hypothetical protein